MREHKYRAWDGKQLHYDAVLIKWNEPQLFDGLSLPGYYTPSFSMINMLAIDEYTGLKDKNGREIYEGDIIGIPNIIPIVVSFDRGAFIQNTVGPYCSLLDFISEHSVFGAPEIIGNIHEDAALLGHIPGPSAE